MPCHVEEFPPKSGEIDTIVEVINGDIRIKYVGDSFYGKYPTPKSLVKDYKKLFETFHYETRNNIFVVISPCPHGC